MRLRTVLKQYYLSEIKHMSQSEIYINHFRKIGMKVGKSCAIFSDIETNEPYLIEIGDSVIIASGVRLLTHDASAFMWSDASDIFGKVVIGNNVFIGENALVLCGVTIADNVIIGAGSIVTKSITESNTVWAGNPAKRICSFEDLKQKYKGYDLNTHHMTFEEKKKYLLDNEQKFKRV